ncbi:hypothetical protein PFISCL1PPCAC_22271, partial [Pristionchus fissidentatus]
PLPYLNLFPFNNNDIHSGYSAGPTAPMTLYTVEQLELIRRLKATGISIQAVVEAFNEFHSVANELDSINFISPPPAAAPTAAAIEATPPPPPPQPATPVSVVVAPEPVRVPVSSVPGPSLMLAGPSCPIETTLASLMPTTLPSPVNSMFLALQSQVPPLPISTAQSMLHSNLAAAVAAAQAAAAAQQQAQLQHLQQPPLLQITPPPTAAAAAATTPSTSSSSEPRPRSQRTPMREITTLDNPQELEDFMSNGEESCIADMKSFITHFSLRQTTVAMMTGVSQPYISKLLNGNHRELSLRCRKNIYCWYLNCRRHPEKLSSFLADPASRLETNGEGELVPQKRERYVFRPVLLRLLEQYFTETPFPDTQRRIEIATACNSALQQDKKGVGLMPKEVVSPQVVSNWFANKRKELRRKNDPRYQEGTMSLHSAIIEALERGGGAGSVPDRSDADSTSPNDDDTMDGVDQQSPLSIARPALPPPDYRIFEALGLAAPSALFQTVKSEPLEIKDQF